MDPLANLRGLEGEWTGTTRLWLDPDAVPEESPTHAAVAAVAGGRFIRIDYDWQRIGTAHDGSILLGFDSARGAATGAFIDSFHMGDLVMVCRGMVRDDGTVAVTGAYAAPPGPDWSWRIEAGRAADGHLIVRMFNIAPDAAEHLAVEARYRRQSRG